MTAMPAKSKNKRLKYDSSLLEWMACWELRCCLDDNKMHAYEQYFKKFAKDKVIIDLGTGPGIMGYLALKNGAKKVYCIDYVKGYLNVAKKMLSDFNNVEFIFGDARNLLFPDADIVVHEIFGHNVFDEFIYDISLNLHNQDLLHKTTPKRIDWLEYNGIYSGASSEHRLYIKDDFPEQTQEFHQLYIKRVENFNETNIKYEPYFEDHGYTNFIKLGSTDLTHIDNMVFAPQALMNLDQHIITTGEKGTKLYGWHAFLDDDIYFSNIVRPNNNWGPMPGDKNAWNRFKANIRFGTNKNPYIRGKKCPFSK
jgi:SAM-dependent methyltransferase